MIPIPDNEELDHNQQIKADQGKPRISLVPMEILTAVARVREYGVAKYGEKESWMDVSPERYRDAMLRHMIEYINNPDSVDSESGLPSLWHLLTNVVFLVQKDLERRSQC